MAHAREHFRAECGIPSRLAEPQGRLHVSSANLSLARVIGHPTSELVQLGHCRKAFGPSRTVLSTFAQHRLNR
jgi:hypothetical protein